MICAKGRWKLKERRVPERGLREEPSMKLHIKRHGSSRDSLSRYEELRLSDNSKKETGSSYSNSSRSSRRGVRCGKAQQRTRRRDKSLQQVPERLLLLLQQHTNVQQRINVQQRDQLLRQTNSSSYVSREQQQTRGIHSTRKEVETSGK